MPHRGADRLSGLGVPQAQCVIAGPGQDACAVAAQQRAIDLALVAHGTAPTGWPVAASQRRRVLSRDQDRMRVPSLLHSAPPTGPSWRIAAPSGCPVLASHRRRVLSEDQDRMRVPSPLNSALFDRALVAHHGAGRLSGLDVPQAQALV